MNIKIKKCDVCKKNVLKEVDDVIEIKERYKNIEIIVDRAKKSDISLCEGCYNRWKKENQELSGNLAFSDSNRVSVK